MKDNILEFKKNNKNKRIESLREIFIKVKEKNIIKVNSENLKSEELELICELVNDVIRYILKKSIGVECFIKEIDRDIIVIKLEDIIIDLELKYKGTQINETLSLNTSENNSNTFIIDLENVYESDKKIEENKKRDLEIKKKIYDVLTEYNIEKTYLLSLMFE